jgi:hypothetical protein
MQKTSSNGLFRLNLLLLNLNTRAHKDSNVLACHSSHNGETNVLVFWVGFREDTRELLVTLTICLHVNPKRHIREHNPRKGHLMLMVILVELLTIRFANIAYHDLVKNFVLEPFLVLPSVHQSASRRIIWTMRPRRQGSEVTPDTLHPYDPVDMLATIALSKMGTISCAMATFETDELP